ncbi:preprotein translocase subunit SecG [Mariprofundus ferrinatatus]|uniref:Protein-export membrane protein SecG n=1 Tax=Mariprofundus ferrinatatus TaxID=1921087 RepID=A0A2K8L0R6_9PROT|nr:preprotein translocase subunit SecG [Mariprofundus ferrinatatus]ATX80900.1 preprotein translocase subunit SecG [Mariprofundus ferrinatatus]
MTTVLIIIHVLIALLLIGVILVQRGQGADIGASFGGGGAQTLFGSRGSGSFLGKMTGGLAAAFMVTSLTLAFFSQQQTGSVVERTVVDEIPVEAPAETQPQQGGFDPSKLKDTTAPADGLPGAE